MNADAAIFRLVRSRHAEPFAWGVRDCAMLAFDAAQEVTGRDPAGDLRGAYGTADEALALLRGMGGLAGLCTARFGPEIAPAEARPGDVALLDRHYCDGESAEHGALGVFWRGMVAVQGANGIGYLPAAAALRAWRIA